MEKWVAMLFTKGLLCADDFVCRGIVKLVRSALTEDKVGEAQVFLDLFFATKNMGDSTISFAPGKSRSVAVAVGGGGAPEIVEKA